MGESGGVTASTSGCGEEGGVKGRGDSAMGIGVRSFEYKRRGENDLRGE